MNFQEKLNQFLANQPPRKPPLVIVKRVVTPGIFFTYVISLILIIAGAFSGIHYKSAGIALYIGVPGIVILLIGMFSRRKQTRILVHGIKSLGHIENEKETDTRRSKKRVYNYSVRYEYEGKEYKGYFKAWGSEADFYRDYLEQNKAINLLFRPKKKKVFPLDYMFTYQ
jgi:uncharacterized membrane protein YtjA (UPF0391 family)